MRRVIQRNADLIGAMHDAEPSTEQYSLFRTYLDARHRRGGMSDMTVLDYAMMVEDTHVDTKVIEYRTPRPRYLHHRQGPGELIAVALTDKMADGLSMVYSYFNPEFEDRSLGTFMILDHIARARAAGLPHVYLGYWVNGSRKMNYKVRFLPQEHLGPKGWERYSTKRPRADFSSFPNPDLNIFNREMLVFPLVAGGVRLRRPAATEILRKPLLSSPTTPKGCCSPRLAG